MERKKCKNCGKIKSFSKFPDESRGKYGKGSKCRLCKNKENQKWKKENPEKSWNKLHPERAKDWYLRKTYNITLEQYNLWIIEQCNLCLICGKDFIGPLHVDHDHTCCPGKTSCGKCIRGLICSKCNNGLGCFNDSIALMNKAVRYLTEKNEHRVDSIKQQ